MVCWLAQSMCCVVVTALGSRVEPEVNSSLATVCGLTAACAARSAAPGVASSKAPKRRMRRSFRSPVVSTTGTAGSMVAAMAFA